LHDWIASCVMAKKKAPILLNTCEFCAPAGDGTKSRTGKSASEAAVGRPHEAAEGKAAFEDYRGHGGFT